MKILVTGGGGMVGRAIVSALTPRHKVSAPRRSELDLLQPNAALEYMSRLQPDMVIHCAGLVGGIEANRLNNSRFFLENSQMGMAVVTAASQVGVPRLLNMASSCIYPRDHSESLREEDLMSGPLEETNEGYAMAKLGILSLCRFLSAESSGAMQCKTIIPCNLYGPHDHYGEVRSHLVPSAIRKVENARRAGFTTVEIWGDGTARREFMHVDDLAQLVVRAMPKWDTLPYTMNAGLGKDYSILEYYQAVAIACGWSGSFTFDVKRPSGMRRKLLDVSRATEWGWQAQIELATGLRDAVRFYRGVPPA